MANGRCAIHGGKSTGARSPKINLGAANGAYSHGIYTKFFRDDEKALLDANLIKLGQVDDELKVMRIRLKRALEARERWEAERAGSIAGADETTSMTLTEVHDDQAPFDGGTVDLEKRVRKLPDFDRIIDSTIARIESLEKTRKELLKDDGEDTDDAEAGRDHVTFTGGLEGSDDDDLPSPFAPPKE